MTNPNEAKIREFVWNKLCITPHLHIQDGGTKEHFRFWPLATVFLMDRFPSNDSNCPNRHACKTSSHAQGLYYQNRGCECELHKNAFFELKLNFISIQNVKAGNVKPPGMHWSKDGFLESSPRSCKKAAHFDKFLHCRSQCLCSTSE